MRCSLGTMVAVALIAGCSFQASCGKLDSDKLEKAIADHFKKEAGIAPDSVSCPSDVKMKEGETFECKARIGETELRYTVTQKDNKGNVEWELRDGVVVSSKLETLIAEDLKKKSGVGPKKIDCGPRIRPSIPDETFECTAIDPEDARWRIGVKITDTNGAVDFRVLGRAGE